MSKPKLKLQPKIPDLEEDEDGLSSVSSLTDSNITPQTIHDVLASIFAYRDEHNTILNVADIMLLIRDSVDKNSKCILKLHQEVAEMRQQMAYFQACQLEQLNQLQPDEPSGKK